MFLYIFQVDTGSTFTLDLNLSTETVKVLKENIYNRTGIPADKQALLLSGGETLFEDAKVSSYRSAGTETNPIFLFNKEVVEHDNPPSPVVNNINDADMKVRIKSCFNMEPSINTVTSRAELAQQLYVIAQAHLQCCEKLIQDQHLQHQGWAAVLANIEDLWKVVLNKLEMLDTEYAKFKEREQVYDQSIDRLETDLEILTRMPLLPSLIEPSLQDKGKDLSLADWIGFKWSNLKDVHTMANSVLEFQHKSHDEFMAGIDHDKKTVLNGINSKEIREISGLQNRLQMLNGFLSKAKKLTAELNEFAQAFHHNQIRANVVRDNSILPDLCKTHETQLRVVSDKYNELCDIRDRCIAAKREFCGVIHRRLQWATHISRLISGLSHKQTLWVNSLNRMEKFINVFDQIHRTPMLYLSYVAEIYRRRFTSQRFLSWAKNVAIQSRAFYEKEMETRNEFESKISQHFLKSLFSGINDRPPQFATQEPEPFDDKLPEVTQCDIQKLVDLFPQYRSLLDVAIPEAVSPVPSEKPPSEPIKSIKRRIVQLPPKKVEQPEQPEQSDQDKISYFSCDVGDLVLLTFSAVHNCYVAFSNAFNPHFLHHECHEALGFLIGEGKEVPAYGFGVVTEKVLCQASKAQNRYNVPMNTRFYRFKAKAWNKASLSRRPNIPLIPAPIPIRNRSSAGSPMASSSIEQALQTSLLPTEFHTTSHTPISYLSPCMATLDVIKLAKEETKEELVKVEEPMEESKLSNKLTVHVNESMEGMKVDSLKNSKDETKVEIDSD
ncbi:RB1-inducible coiled-coil protein 1 [Tetranychus urticae]|uniref:Ubiquitin-like domain-containing protein n=1 Tax=Tetranychus urticae TaxID=32264 RepID=T1KEB9_TETUR|nr:RB1-inducible coiled-coil protein 1 [Tetranychus urticae]